MCSEDCGDSELLKSTDEHTYTTEPLMEVSYDHGRGAGETGDKLRGKGEGESGERGEERGERREIDGGKREREEVKREERESKRRRGRGRVGGERERQTERESDGIITHILHT